MAAEQQLLELIAARREGILAAITRNGYPHLTNVLYLWDTDERTARVSTTADRVKRRVLTRDPHAAGQPESRRFQMSCLAVIETAPKKLPSPS